MWYISIFLLLLELSDVIYQNRNETCTNSTLRHMYHMGGYPNRPPHILSRSLNISIVKGKKNQAGVASFLLTIIKISHHSILQWLTHWFLSTRTDGFLKRAPQGVAVEVGVPGAVVGAVPRPALACVPSLQWVEALAWTRPFTPLSVLALLWNVKYIYAEAVWWSVLQD